jgi:adenine-specific DNA-methyltransferase
MTSNNRYEGQFLDALKAIFIGAKVEGESGYINLMKIKANYFEKGVFPVLMKDIDSACKPFEKGFREELFDKLYDFFQHYFSESGSIYFRNTAQHHNIYEKVYTDDRDVMLFWKTHMLYYVKTDRLFNSMEIEVDGEKFFFDVSGMELKRSNEKRELTYTFKSIKNGIINLTVGYSEKGRKTKIDEIVKAVKDKGMSLDEETLEKAFAVFQKQSEVDYFINKNAKAFLQEQFDLWMYQYVFKGESEFDEKRLKQLQAIKAIAYKIIDFIAQFEDELVKVWNKPKFALNSNYIIALDKILGAKTSEVSKTSEVWKRLAKHKGMKDQIAEWQELGMVDKKFKLDLVLEKNLLKEPANLQFQYLPLDTKYFKDLELDILALFDDLDASLDGWLIHSENYQALNTLLPKFRERVKAIYIDPPYNTGGDGFIYKDVFKHASWLTMMENRLRIGRDLLDGDGIIFSSIDENELTNLSHLLLGVFGERLNTIAVRNNPKGRALDRYLSTSHEYLLAYAKQQTTLLGIEKSDEQLKAYDLKDEDGDYRLMELRNTHQQFNRETRPNLWYPIYVEEKTGDVFFDKKTNRIEVYPTWDSGLEGCWTWGKEKMSQERNYLVGRKVSGRWKIYRKDYSERDGIKATFIPKTIWDETELRTDHAQKIIDDLFGEKIFLSPKPTALIEKATELSSSENEIVVDFFGGSGTTAHAVMNLNRVDGGKRKYILVEMGEHFNTVILPRIKKIAFSDKWKNGEAQEGKGISHFAKYFALEQYEDALKKARYEDAPLFAGTQDAYTSYVFLRDLKMLEAVKVDKKKNKVEVNLENLYDGIDLAETLSCLTGKWIKRITKDTVEFQDGSSASLSAPEWDDVKPLIWW